MSGVAIAAAAVVGAGATIGGSMIQSSAARQATAGALSQTDLALYNSQKNLEYLQGLITPYIQAGSNALGVVQSRLFSSNERKAQAVSQRASLQSKIEQLSKPTDWATFPLQVGDKASERREMLFRQTESDRLKQLEAAKAELTLFDKQQNELSPLFEAQDKENQARLDRISTSLDQVAKLSNIPSSLADIRAELYNDPVYKFRLSEGERSINRAAAARGTFFSGKAIEELSDFSLALTGEETDKFLGRKVTALNAAVTGLNAELGEQNQSTVSAMQLAQLGLGSIGAITGATTGQSQAAAALGTQAGQTQMQGTLAQGQATAGALNGIASSAGGLAALSMLARPKADVVTQPTGPGPFIPTYQYASPQGQ